MVVAGRTRSAAGHTSCGPASDDGDRAGLFGQVCQIVAFDSGKDRVRDPSSLGSIIQPNRRERRIRQGSDRVIVHTDDG
jgi:hypothetical protein